MLWNRLIGNAYRAWYFRSLGFPFPEHRCSGQSTAIALSAVAEAIRKPQEWIEVVDHYASATAIHHVNLAKQAMDIAGTLNLMYFERDRNRIRSCHMTPNQLELK